MRPNDSPRPFDSIRRALEQDDNVTGDSDREPALRLDPSRAARTGIPEVVYAEFKSTEQVVSSLRELVRRNGRALAARCRVETMEALASSFPRSHVVVVNTEARTALVSVELMDPPRTGGRVGILAAGTSDLPVANEAKVMAEEMGSNVVVAYDVGVAGLHRLVQPLERMIDDGVSCLVVAAGMDGALPSVVAGLVAVPVIGLPTSVGYGAGGGGHAALGTMLQTCAPGLVVVNIDNGIGAGATAALIANRFAAASRDERG